MDKNNNNDLDLQFTDLDNEILDLETNLLPSQNEILDLETNLLPSQNEILDLETNLLPSQNEILDLETNLLPSQNEIYSFIPNDVPVIEKSGDNYFFDYDDDDDDQIERISKADEQFLVKLINGYKAEDEKMKNIELAFDFLNERIDVDTDKYTNIDMRYLLGSLVYNLEITLEENYLSSSELREKFCQIVNLISNLKEELEEEDSKEDFKINSKTASKVVKMVRDSVRSLLSIPEKKKAICDIVEVREELWGSVEDYKKQKSDLQNKENKISDDDKQLLVDFISENAGVLDDDDLLDKDEMNRFFDIINGEISLNDLELEEEEINSNIDILVGFVNSLSDALAENRLFTEKMGISVSLIMELLKCSRMDTAVAETRDFLGNIISDPDIRGKIAIFKEKPEKQKTQDIKPNSIKSIASIFESKKSSTLEEKKGVISTGAKVSVQERINSVNTYKDTKSNQEKKKDVILTGAKVSVQERINSVNTYKDTKSNQEKKKDVILTGAKVSVKDRINAVSVRGRKYAIAITKGKNAIAIPKGTRTEDVKIEGVKGF